MVFKDEKDNRYYTDGDRLYVDIPALKIKRFIGLLTQNIKTGKVNLLIHRKSYEATNMGWMVSSMPFEALKLDKIRLIVDGTHLYETYWEKHKDSFLSWQYNPTNQMEKQVILPHTIWVDQGEIQQVAPDVGD